MNIYYIAGLPCSDELYHTGVRNQRWGHRRYQYEDRTLTPLGKIHYAAMRAAKKAGDTSKKAGSAVKSGAKKAVNRQIMNIKKKHPWMMTDEELEAFTKRLNLENAYKEAMSKANKKTVSKGREFVGEVTREIGKKLILSGVDRINNQLSFRQREKNADISDRNNRIRERKDLEARAKYDPVAKYQLSKRNRYFEFGFSPSDEEAKKMAEYVENLSKAFGSQKQGKKKK